MVLMFSVIVLMMREKGEEIDGYWRVMMVWEAIMDEKGTGVLGILMVGKGG